MSTLALDPGPDNRDRTTAIGDGDHQQLMMKAYLAVIDKQTNVAMLRLALEKRFPNGAVPLSYTNGAILQQSAQSLDLARQLGVSRNLVGNQAQMYLAFQVDADD